MTRTGHLTEDTLTMRAVRQYQQERRPPPVMSALYVPLLRVEELPLPTKILALSAGVVLTASSAAFLVSFAVCWAAMGLSGLMDWRYGVMAAKRRGDWSHDIEQWGRNSKLAGLGMVGVLRLLELGWAAAVWDTRGIFAIALASAFVLRDLKTTDEHRQGLGAGPIPLLSTLFAVLERINQAFLPSASFQQPHRDPPPTTPVDVGAMLSRQEEAIGRVQKRLDDITGHSQDRQERETRNGGTGGAA